METISLFSLGKSAGLVSGMNYDILVQELAKLKHEVKKSLELVFSDDMAINESLLSESQEIESIKDIIDEKLSLKQFGVVSAKKNQRQWPPKQQELIK